MSEIKSQLFVNEKTGQCINVEIVFLQGEEWYKVFDDLIPLEDFEHRGWKKVDKDPGYQGMPPRSRQQLLGKKMSLFGFSLSLDYSRLSSKQLYEILNGCAEELKKRGIILQWSVAYNPSNQEVREILKSDE